MGELPAMAEADPTAAPPLVMVTRNRRKVERARASLSRIGRTVETVDLDIVEIQADTMSAIALDKCRKAWAQLRRPLFVTDYGLEVDCLRGFPGPYTDFVRRTVGCDGLIRLAAETAAARGLERAACRWTMCLVYADAAGEMHTFENPLEGHIASTAHISDHQRQDDFLGVFVPAGFSDPLSKFPPAEWQRYIEGTHNVYAEFAAWLQRGEPAR